MIESGRFTTQTVRTIYSRRSRIYGKTIAPMEFSYHLRAIEKAAFQSHEKVLEVAVGPGLAMTEIARRIDSAVRVEGVDLSPGMLAVAQQNLSAAGLRHVHLSEMSASELHFPDASFDVLYNGYMLDLIPLAQMPVILNEFKRVLKPGGRLVLLNMSKPDAAHRTMRERIYGHLPPQVLLYILGGCRPVLMQTLVQEAGFTQVEREFLGGKFPSEIVTAFNPQK